MVFRGFFAFLVIFLLSFCHTRAGHSGESVLFLPGFCLRQIPDEPLPGLAWIC